MVDLFSPQINFTSFLLFSTLSCPLAGKKRNDLLPNLITYSCLYWNPGSPTCFAQCYPHRHKKAYFQGQLRPLLKSLEFENLECNSTSHPEVKKQPAFE